MQILRLVPRLVAVILLVALTTLINGAEIDKVYKAPYSVKFEHPAKELIGDLERGERGDPKRESSVVHDDWYSRRVRDQFEAWGPPAWHYPPAEQARDKSLEWKR
jgi:hypothetical protein